MTNSNGRAPFAPYTTPQGTTVLLEANRAMSYSTVDGIGYTPAELDDLTARKVEEVPFSGDDMARIIRARRGTARATGQAHVFDYATRQAHNILWGFHAEIRGNGNRRMAAVGGTGGHGLIEETYVAGGDHVFTWTPGDGNARFVRRG